MPSVLQYNASTTFQRISIEILALTVRLFRLNLAESNEKCFSLEDFFILHYVTDYYLKFRNFPDIEDRSEK